MKVRNKFTEKTYEVIQYSYEKFKLSKQLFYWMIMMDYLIGTAAKLIH